MDSTRVRQVIQTRITPPKAPKNVIARSGIVNLLLTSEGKKLVLVTAPAGFGKTTIISEYIHRSPNITAWVHITPGINDVLDLITYITSSLKRINEKFGTNIFETISLIENDTEKISDPSAALSEIAGLMINELLKNFTEDVMIVLDDLHEIQNESNVTEFLNLLLKDLPDNIQLIVISRELPALNLSHLRAKRQLTEVTQKELIFTKNEITSLASGVYSRKVSDEVLDYLESSVGGWVTGIHLVMQTMDENPIIGVGYAGALPVNLFDYFAEEIFNKLDLKVKDFLLKTSHLENFDADVCGYILESNNSADLLDYLLGKNIFLESKQFITPDGNSIISYDYVQLFRTFLTAKSKELLPPGEQNTLMLRTSIYYSENSNIEKAIDYSVLSDSKERSEELIIEIFDNFFLNGRFEKLWNWLNSLDESRLTNAKYILYYKGLLTKYYHGDLDKALQYLDRSIEVSGDKNNSENDTDEDFTITAAISRLEIMLNLGKTSEALKTLLELEKKKASSKNKAKIYYYLGNIHFQNNDHKRSLEYLNTALELCSNIEDSSVTEDIYNLLGNINIVRGEFVHAIHYYELTLNMTRSLQKKLLVQGNLSILYSRSGKFHKARVYYNETVKLLRFINSPIFELLVKMTEYTLIFETGDYTSAASLAAEISKLSLKLKNSRYIHLSYRFLGECSYYLGKSEIANNYFELAEKYMNNSTESDSMIISLLKTINKMDTSPAPKTLEELEKVNDYLLSINSDYDRSMAEFYTALYYYKNNNPETCKEYLGKVFILSKEKGYFSFLMREYIRSRGIFSLAGSGFRGEAVNEYLSSIEEIAATDWISTEYKKHLMKLLDEQYYLKMYAFGGLKFILNGAEIPEKKWVRKNRKLLLCYLMLAGNKTLSKDKIIDVFYGDTPIDSADNSFHQAVSNLRTALKSGVDKNSENTDPVSDIPDPVIYQDKTLRLNTAFNYYSDLEEFDNSVKKAGAAVDTPKRIQFLIKAADLYAGDVLEGYYEDWSESLREEYRNKFIKNSEMLLEYLASQNRNEETIEYADKLNRADNINMVSFKESIKAYLRLGKLNFAKNRVDKYITTYREEIGENPPASAINELQELLPV